MNVYATDSSGGYLMYGAGAMSCGKYLSSSSDPRWADIFISYANGFLTAYNYYNKDGISAITRSDNAGVEAWLKNYCTRNPTEDFSRAMISFVQSNKY